jgi:hypothetical protein
VPGTARFLKKNTKKKFSQRTLRKSSHKEHGGREEHKDRKEGKKREERRRDKNSFFHSSLCSLYLCVLCENSSLLIHSHKEHKVKRRSQRKEE